MIPGVLRTRVGYAGGTTESPTYQRIGDHTECVQMDYDPSLVSYEQLLQVFWQAHNPFAPAYSRQYRSIILYHTAEQEHLARASREALEATEAEMPRQQKRLSLFHSRVRSSVYTEIQPYTGFTLAEGYHQKYYLRRVDQIMAEVEKRFDSLEDLIRSNDVARLNGYVGGYGTQAQLEKELVGFGLSPAAERRLQQIVEGFNR